MLHVFIGENESDVRIEAKKFAKDFLATNRDYFFNELDSSLPLNWDELVLSKSLFGGGTLILFDITGADKATVSNFLENLDKFENSQNTFVVSLSVGVWKEEVKRKNIILHDIKSKNFKKEPTNIFALADSIGRRDKKHSWLIYRKLIEEGFQPEEIHGTIFWQIKSLAIAEVSKDAVEAKMKPFVFSKAKGFLKNFKEGEIQKWLSKLVEIYHRGHRGEYTLENALEIFLLGV